MTTHIASVDPAVLEAAGLLSGYDTVNKFGYNSAVGNAAEEDIIPWGGTYHFGQAAVAIDVTSTNAADDSAGAGARTVTVIGLDGSGDPLEETVSLTGSGTVTTAGSFWRVFRAFVATSGTYHGNNTANINIFETGTANQVAQILAGKGQTEQCVYAVRAGYSAYLHCIRLTINKGVAGDVDCSLWYNPDFDDVAAPFSGKRLRQRMVGLDAGIYDFRFCRPKVFSEKSDIWIAGQTSTGSADVTAEMDITLKED